MDTLTLSFVDRTGLAVPADDIKVELNEADTGWREPSASHRRRFSVSFALQRPERPLPLELRITPSDKAPFWPVRKKFLFDQARLMPTFDDDERDDPACVPVADARTSFYHAEQADFGEGEPHELVSVGVVLSRVRDVLSTVKKRLESVPEERIERNPDKKHSTNFEGRANGLETLSSAPFGTPYTIPEEYINEFKKWGSAPLKTPSFVQTPLLRAGSADLQFEALAVAPAMTEAVLEVRGGGVPQLLSVSCPTELLDRVAIASRFSIERPSLPFLVHYRPFARGAGFFDQRKGSAKYPWDWDYLFFPIWSERAFITDPIVRPKVGKGLCYQIAASGNRLALVLPVPHNSTFGRMTDPAWVDSMLVEIQAYLLRRRLVYHATDKPGRVAVSSLSAGAEALRDVLKKAKAEHAFREAYLLDPPDFEAGAVAQAVVSWSNRVGNTTRVRAYARFSHAAYQAHGLIESTRFEQGSSVPSSLPRTYANVEPSRWRHVTEARGVPGLWRDASDVHQLVGATMLTDALRRSDF